MAPDKDLSGVSIILTVDHCFQFPSRHLMSVMHKDEQDDGKGPVTFTRSCLTFCTGKMLLTLLAANAGEYVHATIPFAESYEIACTQAVRVFAARLKAWDAILLKHATRRLDGTLVWSTITSDDWGDVLEKNGEEIGVFLSATRHVQYTSEKSKSVGSGSSGKTYSGTDASIGTARSESRMSRGSYAPRGRGCGDASRGTALIGTARSESRTELRLSRGSFSSKGALGRP